MDKKTFWVVARTILEGALEIIDAVGKIMSNECGDDNSDNHRS